VQQGAAEPVEAGDLERVAGAQQLHDEVEPRPGRPRAAGDVDVDVALGNAGTQERVDLVVGVLIGGRDPRVADQHGVDSSRSGRLSTLIFDAGCRRDETGWRAIVGLCRQTTVCRQDASGCLASTRRNPQTASMRERTRRPRNDVVHDICLQIVARGDQTL
jgi:hypothetical protein